MSVRINSILESLGRFFFQRLGFFPFSIFLLIAPLCASFYLYTLKINQNDLLEAYCLTMQKVKSAFDRKSRKDRFLERHVHAEPYFLDSKIESLIFLEREKKYLHELLCHPAIPNKESILNRVRFLESGENRLSFSEEEIQISKNYKETVEKQRRPIEMDSHDLQKALSLIEDLPIGEFASPIAERPQLLICDFSIRRKFTQLQTEIFEVNMEILKREF